MLVHTVDFYKNVHMSTVPVSALQVSSCAVRFVPVLSPGLSSLSVLTSGCDSLMPLNTCTSFIIIMPTQTVLIHLTG